MTGKYFFYKHYNHFINIYVITKIHVKLLWNMSQLISDDKKVTYILENTVIVLKL